MIRRLCLATALALATLLPAAADPAADIFQGFQAKSSDPIQVDAASLETYEEGAQRVSVFSGGVTVKRANTIMKAGTIKLYSDKGSASGGTDATANATAAATNGSFTRIEASGDISVVAGDQRVTGDTAVVDMSTNTITVNGNVVLSQGPNVITGSKLIVDLSTGRAKVEQAPGKQIRGVFTPNNSGN
jgi:lipopolysaccharide export system protein LptA